MADLHKKLMVEQFDRKLARLHVLKEVEALSDGWLYAIRASIEYMIKRRPLSCISSPQSLRRNYTESCSRMSGA
jgi:hypothetical protein